MNRYNFDIINLSIVARTYGEFVLYKDYLDDFHSRRMKIVSLLGLENNTSFDDCLKAIDNLIWSKASAELDAEWDHLDLMSLVKYLKSEGKTIEEIKDIARNWQNKN